MRLRLVVVLPIFALLLECETESASDAQEPAAPRVVERGAAGEGGEGGSAGAAGELGELEAGAGGAEARDDAPSSFLDGDLQGPLPERLSELGLYPILAQRTKVHSRAIAYEPRYPLWSNGSAKQRFVVLPRGATIDSSKTPWEFPEGTLFFKTFSYPEETRGERAIETRVLRRARDGYEFATYRWNEAQTEAELLDGKKSVPVSVELGAERFDHEIPSTLQCRSCHESQVTSVLGFEALQLNHRPQGANQTQLVALFERGVLKTLPNPAPKISADSELEREVLGYLQGNCVHCHNGSDGPASAFDMSYPVALKNLIGVETTSELFGGLRVSPGDPKGSALYRGIVRDVEGGDAQPMPPLGVQRVDPAAVTLFSTGSAR